MRPVKVLAPTRPKLEKLIIIQGNSLVGTNLPVYPPVQVLGSLSLGEYYEIEGLITCYHPVPEETDSDPLITASGIKLKPGDKIVANNCLEFGTIVEIEDFGRFVVEDRFHQKYNGHCYKFDVLTFDIEENCRVWKRVKIYE